MGNSYGSVRIPYQSRKKKIKISWISPKVVLLLLIANICITVVYGDCGYGKWKCPNTPKCVNTDTVCTGKTKADCSDQSDEDLTFCRDKWACGSGKRKCRQKDICRPVEKFCDGTDDFGCDEDPTFCKLIHCPSHSRKCRNSEKCVPDSQICDGSNDCKDRSDEMDCENYKCLNGTKKCEDNKQCLPIAKICDGEAHCKDTSDELYCWGWTLQTIVLVVICGLVALCGILTIIYMVCVTDCGRSRKVIVEDDKSQGDMSDEPVMTEPRADESMAKASSHGMSRTSTKSMAKGSSYTIGTVANSSTYCFSWLYKGYYGSSPVDRDEYERKRLGKVTLTLAAE